MFVKDAFYWRWRNILRRCTKPSCPEYPLYGGRGIQLCERWRKYSNFLADVGHPPEPGMQIDRIDVNGHYEPGNVRWVDVVEQARNRRCSKVVTFRGERELLSVLAERFDIATDTLWQRLRSGWDIERAVSVPNARGYAARCKARRAA